MEHNIDNPKCAITKACTRDPEVQRAYAELAEAYDFQLAPCPPGDPKKKGRVESGVKYIKRAFVPGREFRDLADANRQLEAWVLEEAGQRIHGTTRERPLTRFAETERHQLQPLPERAFEPVEWKRLQVHRDCHVRLLCGAVGYVELAGEYPTGMGSLGLSTAHNLR